MKSIPIGTLIKGDHDPAPAIVSLASKGFECFSISFWESVGEIDLPKLADSVRIAAESTGTFISALSVYGNPLREDEKGAETRRSLMALVDSACLFGCDLVSGFAGRVPGKSVPESLGAWEKTFDPLVGLAERNQIRIALENCRMGDTWKTGKWNIAINPDAWELMFSAIPSSALGLEWEPCHQVEGLADPLPQMRSWMSRIFHVHGKDSRIDRALLAKGGLYGAKPWHASCFPGNGDTDWAEAFRILGSSSYAGTVDIEGWNDSEWSGEREIEGQVRALSYLKSCRQKSDFRAISEARPS